MPSSIDSHPQRQKIIDGLLAGLSLRKVAASVTPPVSHVAVMKYRKNFVAPALDNASALTKVLLGKGLVDPNNGVTPEGEQALRVTASALRAAPILAVRENRLARLEDRSKRLDLVVTERAEDMATVPGGKSGLLVRKLKQIGSGESARVVEEYAVDNALLAEMREHEKQAAIELGQWQENAGMSVVVNNAYVVMGQIEFGQQEPSQVIDVTNSTDTVQEG